MADLPLDNDFEPEFVVEKKNTGTGIREPASALTGLQARLSATRTGGAIHAELQLPCTERSGVPGQYAVTFAGATLRIRLAPTYVNKSVWLVFGNSSGILTTTRLRVVAQRVIG